MNRKILNFLNSAAGQLIFALVCGCAYFSIVLKFIMTYTVNGGALLAFFFAAAIICGAALIIIKLMKQFREQENEQGILNLFYIHLVVIAVGIVFLIDIIK